MYLSLLLTVILFGCVAMLWNEGLWSNLISLVNVMIAGLVATSLWEPLATWLDGLIPRGTYLWDFAALWFVFGLTYVIMRAITDLLSRVRVRFKLPVDWVGGILGAVWVGWILVCFTSVTLHTAPLAKNFLRGDFYDTPDDKIFWNMFAPDRQWLGFAQQLSRGSLSTHAPEGRGDEEGRNVLDPQGEFIQKYAQRRADYEAVSGFLAK
jgi:hypothetical protein